MRRFYVTMTWDDWPEGGSFGTVVDVPDFVRDKHAFAERNCREQMAVARCDPPLPEVTDGDADLNSPEYVLRTFGNEWHVVDCFDLDEFIERNLEKRGG